MKAVVCELSSEGKLGSTARARPGIPTARSAIAIPVRDYVLIEREGFLTNLGRLDANLKNWLSVLQIKKKKPQKSSAIDNRLRLQLRNSRTKCAELKPGSLYPPSKHRDTVQFPVSIFRYTVVSRTRRLTFETGGVEFVSFQSVHPVTGLHFRLCSVHFTLLAMTP